MAKVQIVTDSASIIEPEVAEELGITVVPLTIRLERMDGARGPAEVYRDGLDIDAEELLFRMGREHIYPRIVGPTAEQFTRIYTHLTRYSNQIISIHSSAGLSPVWSEAQKAARGFLGRCDIAVMDSETVSLGPKILVQKAAELANESVPLAEILRQVRGIIPRIYIVLVTDKLDYLERSRLIRPAQAILGQMLGIKPFLAIEEGRLIPMEKVRSRERAIDKLAEFAAEFTNIEQIVILQSTSYPTEETKALRERLELIKPGQEFPFLLYGPVLASHIGPDGLGLVVYEKPGREFSFK